MKWLYALLFLVPALGYIALASYSLHLPGVYYDEVLQALPAMVALQGEARGPVIQVAGSVIEVAGRQFPLLILPYLGSTQAAALTASFALFGVSVETMRWSFIALGVVVLLLTMGATERLFGARAALITGLLLAVDPTFIFSTRSDNGPTAIMLICKMGGLWCVLIWLHRRRAPWLFAGAFIFGVGLYDKMNFLWILGGLAVAAAIIFPGEIVQRLRRERWRVWAGAIACLMLGAAIPIAYIVATGGGPFRGLGALATESTALGTDNTSVLRNALYRLETLIGLLSGYEILDFYTSTFTGYAFPYQRGLFIGTLTPFLLVLGVLAALRPLSPRRWTDRTKRVLFLLLSSAIILLASVVSPTNLMYHHVLLVYPFPHLIVGSFLSSVADWRRRYAGAAAAAAVAIALLPSLGVTATYHRVLAQTGGIGMWSDAIYDLASYLDDDDRIVTCLDWGISANLMLLSQGRLRIEERWADFLYAGGESADMRELLKDPDRVFIFHARQYAAVLAATELDGPRLSFFRTAAAQQLYPVLETSFAQRDGDTVIEVYRVTSAKPIGPVAAEDR